MSAHVLDRPAWSALTTRQRDFALCGDRVRRFAPDVGPFAAARDDSPESLAALAELVPEHGTVLLLQADPLVLAPGLVAESTAAGVQMVAERLEHDGGGGGDVTCSLEPLGERDVAEMIALATSTRPGPFASRTASLGQFWGIKEDGVLVAMAGERMKQAGFTEISGVCTHPRVRGRGLARVLSAAVAARILERGETPYLHAYATNTVAIRLYESLGFRLRREMHVASIARVRGEGE